MSSRHCTPIGQVHQAGCQCEKNAQNQETDQGVGSFLERAVITEWVEFESQPHAVILAARWLGDGKRKGVRKEKVSGTF